MGTLNLMESNFPIDRFLFYSERYLSSRFDIYTFVLFVNDNYKLAEKLSKEIQLAIELFNNKRDKFEKDTEFDIYQNALEFNQVFQRDLPAYSEIIKLLFDDEALTQNVFQTLKTSSYFVDVWRLDQNERLLANLMILLYRTALLSIYKENLVDAKTGENLVQISSTIEEMIYLMMLKGTETRLFNNVIHWLENWKEEGFREELYNEIQDYL